MRCTNNKSGFSLIEVLVVVAIITLLAGIILNEVRSSRQRAFYTKVVAEARHTGIALEMYKNQTGNYIQNPEATSYNSTYFKDTLQPLVDNQYISKVVEIPWVNSSVSPWLVYGSKITGTPTFFDCNNDNKAEEYVIFMSGHNSYTLNDPVIRNLPVLEICSGFGSPSCAPNISQPNAVCLMYTN